MMNRELIIETIKVLNTKKIDTTELLVHYFKRLGLNPFKAAENADKNLNKFIDFLNNELNNSNQTGKVCLFYPISNRNITFINLDYFFVLNILKELKESITNTEFEIVCAKILKHSLGIENATITRSKSDGGVDFYGSYLVKSGKNNYNNFTVEVIGQAKQYSNNITRPEIEKFLGFIQKTTLEIKYKPTAFIFATTSDYSLEAYQLANSFGIICWTGLQIASFIFNSISKEFSSPIECIRSYLNS